MFGYFRFYKQYNDRLVCRCYKNYYCGLCFSLEKNYGQLSRLLLSYDITLLAIIVGAHEQPTAERIKCLGNNSKKRSFSNEDWKKLAAINVLLASEKINDDICDEKSFKAQIAKFIFRKPIRLAKTDFPEIQKSISEGYGVIQEHEKSNETLDLLANDFSNLMINILETSFDTSKWKKEYVAYISKWLYFIDALDDIDEDISKQRFSPFKKYGSHKALVENHYFVISEYLELISEQHKNIIYESLDNTYEGIILKSIIENTIPLTTERVLTK